MAQPQIDLAERMKVIGARIRANRDTYAGRLDAWHLLGDVSGTFRTYAEMEKAASADFEVMKFQLDLQGVPVNAWGTFRVDPIVPKGIDPNTVKRVTLPDGRDYYLTFLGTVGKDYQVIHHRQGFQLLDHLVGQVDGSHYETMGVLDFGRVVWAQVDPNVSIRVGDDVSNIFLTYNTSHDSSMAFDIFETSIREVCKNTVRLGRLKKLAATLRVLHRGKADERIANLKAEIDEIRNVAMTMQDRLTWLSQRRCTRESLTTIFDRLFPKTKNDDGVEQSSGRRDNVLAEILARYEFNDGDAFPEQRGTPLNLWNAITEHVDHFRTTRGDNRARAESAVFGSGDRLKADALDLIIAESEKMPLMRSAQKGVVVDYEEIGLAVPDASKVN